MEPADILSPDLDEIERRVLLCGLNEWRGPARCTEELAVAMGFEGLEDFYATSVRLAERIESGASLPALDWLRVLLATEIVFASNTVGSGHDWMFTTGLSDEESLVALRRIQLKLPGLRSLLGVALGTTPGDT